MVLLLRAANEFVQPAGEACFGGFRKLTLLDEGRYLPQATTVCVLASRAYLLILV
jgi:hypothetical protein